MQKILEKRKCDFHTDVLLSEKVLHLLIKCIGNPIAEEDLENKGLHSQSVHRIKNRKDKKPLHMVLNTVPKFEKRTYQLSNIMRLVITVEESVFKTLPYS